MKRLSVLGAMLLAVAGLSRSAVVARADILYPATATFLDRIGDAITSDFATTGNRSYVNGVSRLEVGFHTVTDDFVLRSGSGGSAPRQVNFAFSPISGPSGTSTGLFVNFRGILSLPSGQSRTAIGAFDSAAGTFRFNPTYVDTALYATKVLVSRSGNTWMVTGDPAIPPEPGDVAALVTVKGNKTTVAGVYHMPFQVTITCPTCPQ